MAQTQLVFNCTPTQFNVVPTTLSGVGYSVQKEETQFTGTLIGVSGAASGTGQTDFTYDGNALLTFFSGNQTPAMVTELTTALAGTLGAPVSTGIYGTSSTENN